MPRLINEKLILRTLGGIKPVRTAIAKRKINKIIGMHLNRDTEVSAEEKRVVVERYFSEHPDRFRDDVEMTDRLIRESPVFADELSAKEARYALLYDRITLGFHPEEIACYGLYGKDLEEKKAFMSAKDTACAVLRMNDVVGYQVFNNKGLTYRRFRPYYRREAVYISDKGDYDIYSAFIKKHPVFVKKAVFEAMGHSIALIDMKEASPERFFEELISSGPHILEERVVQSKALASLNTSSVNTVRCITFYTKNGIEDPYYFMKIGRAGSFVDNGGAGGILVGINRDTGIFETDGYDEMNNRYEVHPDSGVRLKGFSLPAWEEMKAVCKEMAQSIPDVKYIGWDMTHTNDGWVMIEGNGRSQLIGPQTIYKKGIKREVHEIMSRMDLII